MTEACWFESGVHLTSGAARLSLCLMCQIKMPSDLTSDFCLLGPIWVWGSSCFPWGRLEKKPWQGWHVGTFHGFGGPREIWVSGWSSAGSSTRKGF